MHRPSKRCLTIAAALLSASLAAPVAAHNPLEHPDWCTENGRLVVVEEFAWDGETLARIVRKERESGGDSCSSSQSAGSGTRTCGQFDDDWGIVNSRATGHCDGFVVRFEGATHPDHGTVIHIAEGPEAFNDEERHHDRYRARMGLRAMCVRCEPVVLEPLRPGEPVDPVR
ncbi:MAG: hypothetical protein V2J19_12195 [Wenzhouxiangella sp.]|jgi:hypothetical protein|nr:hypothetical protein [Wenzhouxiangella sp.]